MEPDRRCTMGLFWDLIQQSQISNQQQRSESLEDRVAWLETELERTQGLPYKMLEVLEENVGKDIDGDGYVG